MEKNKIYVVIGLVIVIVTAGAAGWNLGKGSAANNIQEKPASGGELSAKSTNDLYSQSNPADIITLKVATPISFHSGQNVILEDWGFLKKEGLKFEYVGALPTPAEQIAALKSGQIDVFGGHPDNFINAVKAGIKVKAVVRGGLGHPQYPHMTFFVKEDSPIREAKDLIGKKVAPGEGKAGAFDISCGGFYWSRYLKEKNVPREIFMLGFTEEFIQKNPEAVRRFVRANIKANDYTNDFHYISSELVGALQGFEPDINAEHHYSSTGIIQDSALQLWLNWYEEIGQLTPDQIKTQDLYTNEFNPFNEYKRNDPVKDPTFYDTYQLDWVKKRSESSATK